MQPNFDNIAIPSFLLWVDNILCSQGQAYTNTGGPLYPMYDNTQGLQTNIYSAPFRPWVSDSSVTGAYIPSGVYNGNTFILRGTSGLAIDFNNGRVLISGVGLNLSGQYAVKDYCLKYTSDPEEDILFNNKYKFIPKYTFQEPITGIPNDVITLPAVFVKYEAGESDELQFGEGIVNTKANVRCIVLSDNTYILDNILGRLRDQARKYVWMVNIDSLPYNYFGDIKGGYYNYQNLISGSNIGYSYIASARSMKFPETINLDIGRDIFGGYVDFAMETFRNPAAIF